MIALACDHTGVALKAEIAKMLDEMGLEWKDFGNYDAENRNDDYPVYGYKAAKAVADGECDRGIRFDDPAIGVDWGSVREELLSPKDMNAPLLEDSDCNFLYEG